MKLATAALAVGATKIPVVKDLNLEVVPGKILVILGPNGSGKSTILKTLSRQLQPLTGVVSIDGRDVTTLSSSEFARNVAYVAQSVDSKIQLPIQEYVALGRTPHQNWWQWQQSDADKSAVDEALDATALTALRHRPLSQLSGGEQQRAAIALALAQKPTFMLLDEPTAHLDFKHQAELIQLLIKLKVDQKLGLVLVLHDLSAADHLADEIVLLKKNESERCSFASQGPVDTMLESGVLEESFGVKFASTGDINDRHYFVKFEQK